MRTSLHAFVWLALSLGSLPFAQSPRSSTVLGGGPVVPPIAQGVGIDTNAGFVAVAFADAVGVVYLVSSTDAGQSWSAPLPLSSVPGPKVLTTDSVQLIGYEAYVCWVVNVGGGGTEELWYARVDVAGSLPGIVTPETKVPHGAPPGQIRDFDMEVSFGSTLRWLNFAQAVDPGPADLNEQLWVSTSIDGVSFGSVPVTTAFAPGSADVDAIDVDAFGPRVVVAWSDDSSGTNDVYVSINQAGGMGPWSPSQIHVDASPAPAQQEEGLSVDTGAMLTFVVWNEAGIPGGSQRTFGAVLDSVGGVLGAPMPLGPLADSDDCAAVVTQDGEAVAFSRDDRSGVNEIWARRSQDNGASYGTPAKLSTDGASSLDVDTGGKGVIAAVWTAGPHPERVESAYSCDGGESWTTLDLSSTTGDADSAAVGFDPFEKQVLGAWLSDDLGSNRAYSAGYGACLPPPPACFQAANLGPAVSQPTLIVPGTTVAQRSSAGGQPDGVGSPVFRLYRGLDYTPEETRANGLRPLPAQRLTVFYPTGQPKPADGWPVLLFSPAGAFREAQSPSDSGEAALPYPLGTKNLDFGEALPLVEICAASTDGEDAVLGGFLYDVLASGWAVACVGSVGIDSRLDDLGRLVPFGGLLLNDRDPNIFYPPEQGGTPTAEWENFELFWGEKDFTWARQYLAEHASELELDNDVVVTSGVSSGAIYAAFVALGPDRAHASGSSQVMQSTQCAGFLGFETPAWFPAFNHEVPAPHWEGATPGYRAATIADASTSDLAASSVSTWIRQTGSHAASTPALIVYDEGVAADDPADYERDDGNGGCDSWPTATGDPCLTDALLPCVDCHDLDSVCALLGFPDGCFCNPFVSRYCAGSDVEIIDFTRAHDSWNGVMLLQDLLTYGDPDSQLLMETGVLSAYPDLPALQTAIYSDTSGTFPPSAADDPFVRRFALSWLCQLRDDVKGTSSDCPVAVYRNESPNPASLSLTPPILGKTMTCVVDLDTTGHPMAQVVGLDTPASIPLATYVLLCQDSGSGILFQSTASGPLAVIDIAIPNGTYMAGSTFCVQAIHFGGGSGDALSNAQDVVVGL